MQRDYLEIWVMPNYTSHSSLSDDHVRRLEKEINLKINVTFVSWSKALRDFYASFKNLCPPDVIQLGTTWVPTMSHMGYLEQVPEKFVSKNFLENWIAEDSFYNEKMMAVPWLVESGMLIARKDIVKKLGITAKDISTLSGFREVCGRIYNCHNKSGESVPLPFSFSLRAEPGKLHNLIPWFWASGYQIPDLINLPETPFDIDNLMPSLDYFKSLYTICRHSQEDASVHRQVLNDRFYEEGKYVFTVDHWYNIVREAVNGSKTDSPAAYPFEIFEMPSGIYGPTPKGSGSMIGVSSISSYKEESWHVIDYLLSDTYIKERISLCGDLPSTETDFWRTYAKHPQVSLIRQQIRHAKTYPKHPLWASFERILNEELTKLLWHYIFSENSQGQVSSVIERLNRKFRELSSLAWELKNNAG